jgi:hypothetical protein
VDEALKPQRKRVERVLAQHQRVKSKKRDRIPKRVRAKNKRWVKKQFGLTRRQMGAIGAGHMTAPWKT